MQRFPWAAVMRLGIGTYHIPPKDFWCCTLRELVFMRGDAGLERAGLNKLLREWPD
jgi:uncharacterized phage protein (TIGR02216 family)